MVRMASIIGISLAHHLVTHASMTFLALSSSLAYILLQAGKSEVNDNLPAMRIYLKYAQSLLCLGVAASVITYMLVYTAILYTCIVLDALNS